jgi:ketosteroid isomerase-like protein
VEMALSRKDIMTIKTIHKTWIESEMDGEAEKLLDFCSSDITFIPPDSSAVTGKDQIRNWLRTNKVKIEEIKISNLRIEGNNLIAYKVADFETIFASEKNEKPRIKGMHLWILSNINNI